MKREHIGLFLLGSAAAFGLCTGLCAFLPDVLTVELVVFGCGVGSLVYAWNSHK